MDGTEQDMVAVMGILPISFSSIQMCIFKVKSDLQPVSPGPPHGWKTLQFAHWEQLPVHIWSWLLRKETKHCPIATQMLFPMRWA
jgi:hypothetical protein